ncbi:MAG: hypothetical protein RL021_1070 [Bacteroidota bacterium]|jgi:hypothetical protein
MTFGEKVIGFNRWLSRVRPKLPEGAELLVPFRDPDVMRISGEFYHAFFNDHRERFFLLGINPGRFGAGLTGIPFTDPVNLEKDCGISNGMAKRPELSSDFIYQVIRTFGGPALFYKHFFISSVCPLGFVRNGINLNYCDDRELLEMTTPFIINSMKRQLEFGGRRDVAFVIGEGKNLQVFGKINEHQRFFEQLVPLPHPRFILQYRRKQVEKYLQLYRDRLTGVLEQTGSC